MFMKADNIINRGQIFELGLKRTAFLQVRNGAAKAVECVVKHEVQRICDPVRLHVMGLGHHLRRIRRIAEC